MQAQFVTNSQSNLLKTIEYYQSDVVIGGFEKQPNWECKVVMTKTYDGLHGVNRLLFQLEIFLTQNHNP